MHGDYLLCPLVMPFISAFLYLPHFVGWLVAVHKRKGEKRVFIGWSFCSLFRVSCFASKMNLLLFRGD